jgi:NDP-sugar pyrophosphorylase family protein
MKDSNVTVLIPMAGAGKRFSDVGYTLPKPFIPVNGKPMVQSVVENLNIDGKHIFLIQKSHSVGNNLEYFLNSIKSGSAII